MKRWIERVLTIAQRERPCDAIFVLAGKRDRKSLGLELYRRGLAPRIVLSVGRFEIRRLPEVGLPTPLDLLSIAQGVPPPERHYFVEFDAAGVKFEKTRVGRYGTMAEVEALAEWCGRNPEVRLLMVISSGYHLRRVRMCCRALLPKAVECIYVKTPDGESPELSRLSLEAVKLVGYKAVLLRRARGTR
jgi:hypothetical protein